MALVRGGRDDDAQHGHTGDQVTHRLCQTRVWVRVRVRVWVRVWVRGEGRVRVWVRGEGEGEGGGEGEDEGGAVTR